jgi:hypothetical protein
MKYDIRIYEVKNNLNDPPSMVREAETIRELTYAQAVAIARVLTRHAIEYVCIELRGT